MPRAASERGLKPGLGGGRSDSDHGLARVGPVIRDREPVVVSKSAAIVYDVSATISELPQSSITQQAKAHQLCCSSVASDAYGSPIDHFTTDVSPFADAAASDVHVDLVLPPSGASLVAEIEPQTPSPSLGASQSVSWQLQPLLPPPPPTTTTDLFDRLHQQHKAIPTLLPRPGPPHFVSVRVLLPSPCTLHPPLSQQHNCHAHSSFPSTAMPIRAE